MSNALERFQIIRLHGNKNIDVKIDENTLILVGENGSGKTTFLRILFHFLSGHWLSLAQFRFDSIVATIDGKEYRINHKDLSKNLQKVDRRILMDLPMGLRNVLMNFIKAGRVDQVPVEIQKSCEHYGLSFELIMRRIEMLDQTSNGQSKEVLQDIKNVQNAITAQILYLPTYRRIERELDSIFKDNDIDDFRRRKNSFHPREYRNDYIELVEFGMKDVQSAINTTLDSLKEFAREKLNKLTLEYLGDVVNQEYSNVGIKEIADVSEETVHAVLNRIDENILTKVHKEHIFKVINKTRSKPSPDEHSKIIFHYFLKLLMFQAALQEKEKPISDFCALCSKYIVDKPFVYDGTKFSFSIIPKDGKEDSEQIGLSDLSSGEKQIVSLFSHLYLSGINKYFVLIDEPELSLSVPWQRRFLTDIKKGDFCAGLVAVTHSPFIYDNELLPYAHSLGEFIDI
jgi:energy-coupling factor transporter ATP-binding protein EcfA2